MVIEIGDSEKRRRRMSMKPQGLEPIPEETVRIAKRSFPKGTLAMQLRDELGPIYTDEAFAHLFAKRGRGAEEPWRLALVTVFQAIEGLTDRQAAEYVRGRLDWKYALSLALDDEGFDAKVLSDFRERLIMHRAVDLVLEPILDLSKKRGWLKAGGKQRTDSTAVLSSVRALNSLESVGESMRAALNAIAEVDADWLLAKLDPDWFDLYVHRFELARFPKAESKKQQLRQQVGRDVDRLLVALEEPGTPKAVRDLPEIALLRQIFAHRNISSIKATPAQINWSSRPSRGHTLWEWCKKRPVGKSGNRRAMRSRIFRLIGTSMWQHAHKASRTSVGSNNWIGAIKGPKSSNSRPRRVGTVQYVSSVRATKMDGPSPSIPKRRIKLW